MPKLTKRIVEAANPNGRDYFIWDNELPGFGLRVFESGKRSYLVQYRAEGRTRRYTIGLHGPVTCDEARKRARELLGKVAAGGNPADVRAEERKFMTMTQLCDEYLKAAEKGLILGRHGTAKKASTLATDRGRIARHIKPLLGQRKVRDITSPDVNRFLRDIASGKTATNIKTGFRGRAIVEGGKGTAARTVGLLGGILSYAVSEGIIVTNPVRGVKRPADERRKIRLSIEQYKALGAALRVAEIEGKPWQAIAAIRLLALTGCRRGEIEKLRWEEIDLAGRCLRLADSKTGKSIRPLSLAATKLLTDLKDIREQEAANCKRRAQATPYVFPGGIEGRAFAGLPKAWLRVMEIAARQAKEARDAGENSAPLNALTPHGLRHAFASIGHDMGLTVVTVGALLGQSSGTGTVTDRYIHHVDTALIAAADRVAEKIAAALDEWAGADHKGGVQPLEDVQ